MLNMTGFHYPTIKTLCLVSFFQFVWIFQSPRKWPPLPPNYGPQVKTVPVSYIPKSLANIRVVFGLKKLNILVQSLSFAMAIAQVSIAADIVGDRHLDVTQASLFAGFLTSRLFSRPVSKIRAGKLLVGPRHLKVELVGGRPQHHYWRACRCRPIIYILLMIIRKNNLKQLSL